MNEVALTNRQRQPRPTVENIGDTSRVPTNQQTPSVHKKYIKRVAKTTEDASIDFDKDYEAKLRKTIKVDPDIKSLIEIFSDFEGTKEYETLRKIAKFYFENNYDERAQRIISSLQNNKFI